MPPIVGVPALHRVVGGPVDAYLLADPPADQPAQQYRRPETGHQDRHRARGQERDHEPAPPTPRRASSSEMTTRSLNSIDWSPICWTDSWPFPATTTTSPARRTRARQRSRAAVRLDDEPGGPVAARPHLLDDRGRVLAAGIVRGEHRDVCRSGWRSSPSRVVLPCPGPRRSRRRRSPSRHAARPRRARRGGSPRGPRGVWA